MGRNFDVFPGFQKIPCLSTISEVLWNLINWLEIKNFKDKEVFRDNATTAPYSLFKIQEMTMKNSQSCKIYPDFYINNNYDQ